VQEWALTAAERDAMRAGAETVGAAAARLSSGAAS
jgi:hypothetical protein